MRKGLYMFRHSMRLTQKEMAKKIGCSRATYLSVERGTSGGNTTFWRKLQQAFNIADADLGALMRVDEPAA